ncbi:MAG TPA: Lsr2 family protein [Acidimicrobiales bacterium]|nr:Lsr2 family protein [Acidimicrobiales bacterium]
MARRVIVQVSCDLCGAEVGPDAATEFAVGGRAYTIDLCQTHKDEFLSSFDRYIEGAQPLASRRAAAASGAEPARRRTSRRATGEVGAIREWARANGFDVSDRGRIPAAVIDAYNARSGS